MHHLCEDSSFWVSLPFEQLLPRTHLHPGALEPHAFHLLPGFGPLPAAGHLRDPWPISLQL